MGKKQSDEPILVLAYDWRAGPASRTGDWDASARLACVRAGLNASLDTGLNLRIYHCMSSRSEDNAFDQAEFGLEASLAADFIDAGEAMRTAIADLREERVAFACVVVEDGATAGLLALVATTSCLARAQRIRAMWTLLDQAAAKERQAETASASPPGEDASAVLLNRALPSGYRAQTCISDARLPQQQEPDCYLLQIDGRSLHELAEYEARLQRFLSSPGIENHSFADLVYTLNLYANGPIRRGLIIRDREHCLQTLSSSTATSSSTGTRAQEALEPPFFIGLFDGQPYRRSGLGLRLYETHPEVRRVFNLCDRVGRRLLKISILETLFGNGSARLSDQGIAYFAGVALSLSLAELIRTWALPMDLIVGHGNGEIPAAYTAGIFSLEAAVGLAAATAASISGAVAGSTSQEDAARELERTLANLGSISFSQQSRPVRLLGAVRDDEPLTLSYWTRGTARTNILSGEIEPAHASGLVLNIGPCVKENKHLSHQWLNRSFPNSRFLNLLDEDSDEWLSLNRVRLVLHQEGIKLDFAAGERGFVRWRVPAVLAAVAAPSATSEQQSREGDTSQPLTPLVNTVDGNRHSALLERRLSLAQESRIYFETGLSRNHPPFLADHQIFGDVIAPAALLLEMVLEASPDAVPGSVALERVQLHKAVIVPSERRVDLQLVIEPETADNFGLPGTVRLFSRDENEPPKSAWHLHLQGRWVRSDASVPTTVGEGFDSLQRRLTREKDVAALYENYRARGLEFGPAFRSLRWIACGTGEGLGQVVLPQALCRGNAFRIHPIILDACFQMVGAVLDSDAVFLPTAIESLRLLEAPSDEAWVYVRVMSDTSDPVMRVDALIFTQTGAVAAMINGLHLHPASGQAVRRNAMQAASMHRPKNTEEPSFRQRILENPANLRQRFLTSYLTEHISRLTGLPPQELSPDRKLFMMGLQSLHAVELTEFLKQELQMELSHTLLFEYPTIERLAGFILSTVNEPEPKMDTSDRQAETVRAPANTTLDDVAALSLEDLRSQLLAEIGD